MVILMVITGLASIDKRFINQQEFEYTGNLLSG